MGQTVSSHRPKVAHQSKIKMSKCRPSTSTTFVNVNNYLRDFSSPIHVDRRPNLQRGCCYNYQRLPPSSSFACVGPNGRYFDTIKVGVVSFTCKIAFVEFSSPAFSVNATYSCFNCRTSPRFASKTVKFFHVVLGLVSQNVLPRRRNSN
jgi:hypothetical protein